MKLSEDAKEELLSLAQSAKLREDLTKVARNRINPFLVNGQVDMHRLLTFLDEYNEFMGHKRKPFRPMVDKDMRL